MKIYKKSESGDKKEMFLQLVEDEDGDAKLQVVDINGDNEVDLIFTGEKGVFISARDSKANLILKGYNIGSMEFDDDGELILE